MKNIVGFQTIIAFMLIEDFCTLQTQSVLALLQLYGYMDNRDRVCGITSTSTRCGRKRGLVK